MLVPWSECRCLPKESSRRIAVGLRSATAGKFLLILHFERHAWSLNGGVLLLQGLSFLEAEENLAAARLGGN